MSPQPWEPEPEPVIDPRYPDPPPRLPLEKLVLVTSLPPYVFERALAENDLDHEKAAAIARARDVAAAQGRRMWLFGGFQLVEPDRVHEIPYAVVPGHGALLLTVQTLPHDVAHQLPQSVDPPPGEELPRRRLRAPLWTKIKTFVKTRGWWP